MTITASDWPAIIADPSIAEVWNTETGEAMQLEWVRKQGCWYHIAPFFEAAWMFDEDGSHRCYPYAIRLRTPEPVEGGRRYIDTAVVVESPEPVSPSMTRLSGTIDRIEAEQSALKPVAPAEIPEWAKVRACELANAEEPCQQVPAWEPDCVKYNPSMIALARLIAKHEKEPEPVDPLSPSEVCEVFASLDRYRAISAARHEETLRVGDLIAEAVKSAESEEVASALYDLARKVLGQ